MAWVRFPDGSRRKVERAEQADAEHDLTRLLALRAQAGAPGPRRERLASFGDVTRAWLDAGCPTAAPSKGRRHAKPKSNNTIDNARSLLNNHVVPAVGALRVDRTTTERLEEVFHGMARAGYSTSTVDRTWLYLNQACQFALRQDRIRKNPAEDVLLPAARPPKERKSLTIEQFRIMLTEAIPADRHPAMWVTAFMCGPRPGELTGLRWSYVEIDDEENPYIDFSERAHEERHRYVGQRPPKTKKGERRIGLHPLVVAAMRRHREEMQLLGLYDPEGFVFCTRNGTPFSLSNLRRMFRRLCERAGLGDAWTTYEGRHTFVSLVSEMLDDLAKVADLAGHRDLRTTEGYRHRVRPSLPHAIEAWDNLLAGHSKAA
jgi:integrase